MERWWNRWAPTLGMDLGTTNTVVWVPGTGVIIQEPSVVAWDHSLGNVVAVGRPAQEMIGRTPEHIHIVHPVQAGAVTDFTPAAALLSALIQQAYRRLWSRRPLVVVSCPPGLNSVEATAAKTVLRQAGAGNVVMVDEPIAAALGAGLPIHEPLSSTMVDIGGGTTTVTMMATNGVVASRSIRVAGEVMDNAIVQHIRQIHHVTIGPRTAEGVKVELGSADPIGPVETQMVPGLDTVTGRPKTVRVTSSEIHQALARPVDRIVEAIQATFEESPPELAGDALDRGLVLTGGGSLLRNLDTVIQQETGIPVHRVADPLLTVARGVGRLMEDVKIFTAMRQGGCPKLRGISLAHPFS